MAFISNKATLLHHFGFDTLKSCNTDTLLSYLFWVFILVKDASNEMKKVHIFTEDQIQKKIQKH